MHEGKSFEHNFSMSIEESFRQFHFWSPIVDDLVCFCFKLIRSGGLGNNQVRHEIEDEKLFLALNFNLEFVTTDLFVEAKSIRSIAAVALLAKLIEVTDEDWSDAKLADEIRNQLLKSPLGADSVFADCVVQIKIGHSIDNLRDSFKIIFDKYIVAFWNSISATEFNAAGLHSMYRNRTPGAIRAHYIRGDMLTTLQRWTPLPNAAGTPIPHSGRWYQGPFQRHTMGRFP
jgi:hypothetical protein